MNNFKWTLYLLVFSFSVIAQEKGGNPYSVHLPQKNDPSENESNFSKATGYFLAEKYNKALTTFESLAKKDKENASLFYMISRCYSANEELKSAIKFGERSISFEDSDRTFFLHQVSLFKKTNDTKNVTETLQKLFSRQKELPEDYITLGDNYRVQAIKARDLVKVIKVNDGSQKQLKLAEEEFYTNLNKEYNLYKKYSTKYPVTQEIHSKKLNTLFILNRYDEAWSEGINFIEQNPNDLSIIYDHCTTFFKKYPEKCISLLEQKTSIFPSSIENKLLLHDFYNQTNAPQKASEIILSIFDDNNFSLNKKLRTTQSYLNTPTALHQETAKKMMAVMKNQYPNSSALYSLEGDYYLFHLNIDSARLSYLKAVKQSPNTPEVWDKIFRISLQNKKYNLLIQDTKQAIAKNSKSPILHYYQGLGYYNQKEYDATISTLEVAKELKPTSNLDLQINHLLAETYYKNDQLEKAWNTYDLILEVTPNDHHTLNNYSYFLALSDTKLSQAESMAKTLMRLKPNEATYIDTYAWVLYKNKKYSEALQAIEPIATHSTSAEVIEHYGDILAKNNKHSEALKQWKKALQLDPENKLLPQKITERETK